MRLLGFEVADIGMHSIWKGAISYLASLPGGPPIAAVCIRAGWMMGNISDIYMRYISSGDQFVGQCFVHATIATYQIWFFSSTFCPRHLQLH